MVFLLFSFAWSKPTSADNEGCQDAKNGDPGIGFDVGNNADDEKAHANNE